jgi:hypothetical protein
MKLWFEGWNVNALWQHAIPANAPPAVIAALNQREQTSCDWWMAGRQCPPTIFRKKP